MTELRHFLEPFLSQFQILNDVHQSVRFVKYALRYVAHVQFGCGCYLTGNEYLSFADDDFNSTPAVSVLPDAFVQDRVAYLVAHLVCQLTERKKEKSQKFHLIT